MSDMQEKQEGDAQCAARPDLAEAKAQLQDLRDQQPQDRIDLPSAAEHDQLLTAIVGPSVAPQRCAEAEQSCCDVHALAALRLLPISNGSAVAVVWQHRSASLQSSLENTACMHACLMHQTHRLLLSAESSCLQAEDLEDVTAVLCKLSMLPSELAMAGMYDCPEKVVVQLSQGDSQSLEGWLQACQAQLDSLQHAYASLLDPQASTVELYGAALQQQAARTHILEEVEDLLSELSIGEAALRVWLEAGTLL